MDDVELGAERYMEQMSVNDIRLVNKLAKKHGTTISIVQNTA